MVQFIIGISGKQGSGKTTLSRNLSAAVEKAWGLNVRTLKFAGPIYDLHDEVQDYLEQYGFLKQKKNGKLLQRLGDLGKEVFSPTIWTDCMDRAIHQINDVSAGDPVVVIIDDLRFSYEMEYLRKVGKQLSATTILIRLSASEHTRKARAHSWRDTTGHDSETSLDAVLDGWDLGLDTESHSQEETLRKVLAHVERDMALLNPETLRTERAVAELNQTLHWLKERDKGANFRWDYDRAGTKQLSLISVEPITRLAADREAQFAAHTEKVMQELEKVDFVFEKPSHSSNVSEG